MPFLPYVKTHFQVTSKVFLLMGYMLTSNATNKKRKLKYYLYSYIQSLGVNYKNDVNLIGYFKSLMPFSKPFGLAPTTLPNSWPSLAKTNVGIAVTSQRLATSGLSSTSTL